MYNFYFLSKFFCNAATASPEKFLVYLNINTLTTQQHTGKNLAVPPQTQTISKNLFNDNQAKLFNYNQAVHPGLSSRTGQSHPPPQPPQSKAALSVLWSHRFAHCLPTVPPTHVGATLLLALDPTTGWLTSRCAANVKLSPNTHFASHISSSVQL